MLSVPSSAVPQVASHTVRGPATGTDPDLNITHVSYVQRTGSVSVYSV